MRPIVCTPRVLTAAQAERAVRRGLEINPHLAGSLRFVERRGLARAGGPRRLALLLDSRWPASGKEFTVQFLDNPSAALRSRILAHMNAWSKTANVSFRETGDVGLVRIARHDSPPQMAGYWSYVGTQVLGIEEDQATMNLEGFTMKTPESEFIRVVRHETGHTIGFDHEHMRTELVRRINRKKAIAYFSKTQGWSEKETVGQVLTPLAEKSIMGTTEADPLSIMCYEIPGAITNDGKPIVGGSDINDIDYAFAAKVYPKATPTPENEAKPSREGPAQGPTSAGGNPAPASADDEFHLVILDGFDSDGTSQSAGKASGGGSGPPKHPKFARVFATYSGARVSGAIRLRSDAGDPPTAFGRIIGLHERIKNYTNRQTGTLPSDEDMIAFGGDLFETLFQDVSVRSLYNEARARQRNRKLNVILTSMIPWIAEKPWEFAYDTVRKSFLATEEVHLLRNAMTAVPADLANPTSGPLRILVASAQPVGLGHLSIGQEVEVIRRGFAPLIDAGQVTVEVLARATPGRIQGRLSTGEFNVVHFIGHGTFDEEASKGFLIFEDDRGGTMALGERQVREIFCRRGVNLVFLNACQSGSGGHSDFNKGIAQALVAHGLPALVANQYSVLDVSATSFAQYFYWSLAQGMGVAKAASEARIAVNYSMEGELIDWAVPVVYARDPNMALCRPPERTTLLPTVSVVPSNRRAIQRHAQRVAVWDIDSRFPGLERTLQAMTDAQETFGFETVTMSTPIDVWDKKSQAPDGGPYLWAEKMARRLKAATIELRADVIVCVTRHWLRDNTDFNIYGWWPAAKAQPIVIFSVAGFDGIPAEGKEADRAIANVVVELLAGYLADMGTHKKANNCPMYYNPRRNVAHLLGRQKFDAECIGHLRKQIPNELSALDTLLRLFP